MIVEVKTRELKCFRGGFYVSLMGIVLVGVLLAVCRSFAQDASARIVSEDRSLSVDLQNAPASEVFEELAKRTAYEFILPEELLENRITLKFSGIDLDEGIRRIVTKAGADNHALVYSLRESEPGKAPLYRVKVVLMGSVMQLKEASSQQASFEKASDLAEEVAIQPDSFPVVREEPVPSEVPFLDAVSEELVPQGGEFLSEQIPTPVELSSETEDFPHYRPLESNQIPRELNRLTPP